MQNLHGRVCQVWLAGFEAKNSYTYSSASLVSSLASLVSACLNYSLDDGFMHIAIWLEVLQICCRIHCLAAGYTLGELDFSYSIWFYVCMHVTPNISEYLGPHSWAGVFRSSLVVGRSHLFVCTVQCCKYVLRGCYQLPLGPWEQPAPEWPN